jgi:hypothetical protein
MMNTAEDAMDTLYALHRIVGKREGEPWIDSQKMLAYYQSPTQVVDDTPVALVLMLPAQVIRALAKASVDPAQVIPPAQVIRAPAQVIRALAMVS